MILRTVWVAAALGLLVLAGCHGDGVSAPAAPGSPHATGLEIAPGKESYHRIAREIETALLRELALFYPATVDPQGGFTHALPQEWASLSPKSRSKNIVYQARMLWTAAEIAKRRPELRAQYHPYVQHGFAFLQEHMWDAKRGGFLWQVDQQGKLDPAITDKHAYGLAFGMYACANAYEATKDPATLELAMKAFRWLDENGHDDKNGGYYEAFNRDGDVLLEAADSYDPTNPNDIIGTPYGYKSMNTHIHIMEALARLTPLVPDEPLLRRRLDEVFLIVRDRMAVRPGCLNLIFTPDWKSPPMYDSFGHDVETAYLIDEADTVRHGAPNSKTRMVAKMLVDHALLTGWDPQQGAMCYEGFAFGVPHNQLKTWWTQAENLNAMLLMHEKYGKDDPRYWRAFVQQWRFISDRQIDPRTGGWYYDVGPDNTVVRADLMNPWKAAYHTTRAMLNVSDRLQKLQ